MDSEANRPDLKYQLCHTLAAVWIWASYLTNSEAVLLRLGLSFSPFHQQGWCHTSPESHPVPRWGWVAMCSSSELWYHWDNHRPCPLFPSGPAILCNRATLDLGLFSEFACRHPASSHRSLETSIPQEAEPCWSKMPPPSPHPTNSIFDPKHRLLPSSLLSFASALIFPNFLGFGENKSQKALPISAFCSASELSQDFIVQSSPSASVGRMGRDK